MTFSLFINNAETTATLTLTADTWKCRGNAWKMGRMRGTEPFTNTGLMENTKTSLGTKFKTKQRVFDFGERNKITTTSLRCRRCTDNWNGVQNGCSCWLVEWPILYEWWWRSLWWRTQSAQHRAADRASVKYIENTQFLRVFCICVLCFIRYPVLW